MNVTTLTAVHADITRLEVDAVVNAANTTLLGGGGVDGAIHRAAGPKLLEECRALGGCAVGEAKLTRGYSLPAKYVIHTVGPVWRGGDHNEAALLAACYRNSLALARDHEVRSIAFPAISCGVYHYPPEQAVAIAVQTIRDTLEQYGTEIAVTFACFDQAMLELYQNELRRTADK